MFKVSKLSIAEQIFESNCELMEIMSGVFHQKKAEEQMLGQMSLHQRLLLASYLQNGAEAETMLVESGLGGEY